MSPGVARRVGGDEIARGKCPRWTTLDLVFNYTFNLPPPAPAEVPGFAKDGGKNVRSEGRQGEECRPCIDG